MDVTLLGMVIDVRALHPAKAPYLMDVTLLGMMIDVRALHPRKKNFICISTIYNNFSMVEDFMSLHMIFLNTKYTISFGIVNSQCAVHRFNVM